MNVKQYLQGRRLGVLLALFFSALSILLTVILAEAIGVMASAQVKSNIGTGLAELAWQTADKLDRSMYERYREVRLMAQRRDLRSAATSLDDKRAVLNDRQATYAYYAWIGMTDPSGKVLVATRGLLEGADVSRRPWFGNALDGIHVGDVHDASLLASLLPKSGNEPKRFVDIAFPYTAGDGSPLGVLGVHLSWEWAREVQRSIMEPIAAERHVNSMIVDGDGVVLLGPAAWQGKQLGLESLAAATRQGHGFRVETFPDGHRYLVGYSRSKGYADYPGLNWKVLVTQKLEEAYQPVRDLQRRVLWGGIGLALVFSLLGLLAARMISRPLARLAQSAQRMQQGEALCIIPDRTYYEVGTLSNSLNALLADLQQKETDLRELNLTLEGRVQQRTRELEQALATVRASERRIGTIIESAQDAFVGVDLRGEITDWNSQAEKMFGWRREEAVGRPLAELVIPARFHESYRNAVARFNDSGQIEVLNQRIERLVVNRDGAEFPVEVTIGLAGGHETYFFGAFLHDISERKKVERMKSEFISTVSHELRTPLTSIRASLSMLTDGMAGELPPDVGTLLDIAHDSCERLVRLVNDVLDTEKIASGNMTLDMRRQPLRPLAEQALQAIEGYAQQYKVKLLLLPGTGDITADVDTDRTIQVLHNLLSNAIKFSPPGNTVTLAIGAVDGIARITVADRGSGIPPEFHARIFQKFAQADATDSRQKGGTGLGLSICKSIVEAHGGAIHFESEPGQGTRFHVDLPLH